MIRPRQLLGLTILLSSAASCGRGPVASTGVTPVPPPAPARLGGGGGDMESAPRSNPTPIPAPVPDSVQERLRLAMRAIELFGDSLVEAASGSPAAGPNGGPAADEVSWDIDVRSFVTHDRVDRYVKLFSGPARERFVAWLQRGHRYEPMIRATFRARGIPEDLYYLGAVESGYDPHAVSRAYAVGIWQFMTSTARGFGLRVDWWVDERRDPVKSTDAAARFLSALKDQFGSFYLAAAAYNGGPGRVQRGLTRYADDVDDAEGEDRFFALVETGALRAETMNYVPQLIAAAYIAKDAAQFGVALDTLASPTYAYDSVSVGPDVPMARVAEAALTSVAEMQALNPFILRGVTPPDGHLFMRVPLGQAARVDSVLSQEPREEFEAYRTHTTRKGETLASVAKRYQMTSRQVSWYNPRVKTGKRGVLAAGQKLRIPSSDVLAAAFDVPDPAIEKYGTRVRGARVHVVKRGESLGLIARRYRTSVATLVRLNGLKKHVIYPGQTILVSGRAAAPRRSSAKPRASTKSSSAKSKAASKGKPSATKKKTASTGKAASSKP